MKMLEAVERYEAASANLINELWMAPFFISELRDLNKLRKLKKAGSLDDLTYLMQNADDALVARLNNGLRDGTKTLEDLAEEADN